MGRRPVYTYMLLFVGGLLLLAVGALAQDSAPVLTPEATPEVFDCARLTELQAALAARLATFPDDVATDRDAALGAMYAVGAAYQEIALQCGYIPPNIDSLVIGGADLDRVMTVLETLSGDPLRGQLLYNGTELPTSGSLMLGCAACHAGGVQAPPTEGTWTRWDEIHQQEAQFAGYTFERYAAESILMPALHVVEGYSPIMPPIFQDSLSYQDLADLISYLNSQDQIGSQ